MANHSGDLRNCRACRNNVQKEDTVVIGKYRYCNHHCSPSSPISDTFDSEENEDVVNTILDSVDLILDTELDEEIESEFGYIPDDQHEVNIAAKPESKYYILTSAVSNAPVCKPFLDALKTYADHIDAELLIRPLRYHNRKTDDDIYWDDRIAPFVVKKDIQLNDNWIFLAGLELSPTKVNPMSGIQSLGKHASIIVAHPRVAMRSIATPASLATKFTYSTGAVTMPNYSEKVSGVKAEFNHKLSALLVEIQDDKVCHTRHLHWKGDSFIDLNNIVYSDSIHAADNALGLIMGDWHSGHTCPKVKKGTLKLCNLVKPYDVVWHDLLDFESQNHHHRGNIFKNLSKALGRKIDVYAEILRSVRDVIEFDAQYRANHVIVASNHNEAFQRWINDCDWKEDVVNAKFYLQTAYALVDKLEQSVGSLNDIDAYRYWFKKIASKYPLSYELLDRKQDYFVGEANCSYHGDKGVNGARGSLNGFAKTGCKFNIGHSHSCGIMEGTYQTGTSTVMDMGYNIGLSSWSNTHVLTYNNDSRVLIHFYDGKFTTLI